MQVSDQDDQSGCLSERIQHHGKQDLNNKEELSEHPKDLNHTVCSDTASQCDSISTSRTRISELNEKGDVDEPFDGGYGWVIVGGGLLVQITAYGTSTSWGVMQDYFVSNTFKDDPDALLKLSFVGTCCLVAANSMGPAAQIVASRFGVRVVMACGGLLVVLGLELAGSATQIWHLYLTQGILFGSGASILYVTIMAVAPQYFTRRRGVAIGLITSGSGIGGVIIPFIMTPINASLGYPWTYRVLGLLCLICSTIATIVVRDRIPKPREKKRFSDIIKFEILKDPNYILWCLGSAVMLMGYFIPFFYLPKYATDLGLTPTQGSSLVAIASACNSIGRIMSGAAADKIGPLNVDVIFSIIGGLSSLLIWRFAYSFSVLVAFSVIFGLFCGSYFALVSTITAAILGPEKFCSGLSFILISNTVSVFAPNIANALELNIGAEPSLVYKIFSGVTYIVGALIIFILKMRINRDIFAKV